MRVPTYGGDYAEGVVIVPSTNSPMVTDDLAHTYVYNTDGTLASDTCSGNNHEGTHITWVKTYTYTNGNLTGESQWAAQ